MAQTKSQTPILRDQIIEALRGIKLRQGQALRTVDVPPHVYEGAKEFVKTIPPDEAIFRTYHMYDILNPGETQLLEAEAKIAEWQSGCKALLRYALNLLLAPKRPEFRRLKLSNSYYMYQVAKKLQHAEEVLMAMGYKRTGSSQEVQELSYEGEVNIATLHEAATDLVFLYSELELLKEVVQQILSNPEYQRLPARVTLQTLLDARKRDIPFRYDMMWAHLMRLVYQQQAKQSRHEESQQAPSTQASHVSSGQASSSQAHLEVRNNRQDLRRGSAPAVSGFRGGEQDRFFSLQDPSAEQTQLPGGRGDQSYGYQQHGASGAFLHGQQQQQRGYPYYPTHEGKHARVVGDGENHEAVHRRQKHKEVSSDSPQMTHLSEQKPTASSSLYQNAPGMQPATANSQHYQNAPGMQPATANSQLYQNAPGMQPATANSQLYQNAPGIQPATARSQHYRNLLMQSGVAIPASTVGSTINSSSSNGIYQNLPSANTTNTPSSSNSEVANTGRDPNLQSIETRLRGIFQQYPDLVGNKSAGQGDDYPVNSPQQSESSFDPSDLPPPMVESTQQLQNLFSPDEGIVSGLINVRSVQDDGAGGPDLFMSFGSPPTQLQGLRFDNDYEKQLPPLIQLQDSTHTAQESEGEPSIRETLAPSSHQPYKTTTGEMPSIHSSDPIPSTAPPTSGVAVPGYTQPSRKKPQQKSQTFDVLEEEHPSPQLKRHHSHQPYTTTTGETPPIHSSEPNPTFAPPTTSGVAVPGYTQPSRKKPQQKSQTFDVLEEEHLSPQLKHHHSASRLDRMEMPPSQVPSSGATEKVKHFDKHLLKVDGDYGVSQNQMRPRVSATSSKSRDNSEKLTIDDLNQGIANSQKPVPMPRNQSKPPLKPVSKDLAPADNIPGIKNMLVPPLHHVKPQDYSSTKTVGDAGVSENRGRPEHLQLGEHSYRRAIHGDPQRELPRGHSDGQFQHRPEIPRPKVVRQWAMEKSPSTTDKSKAMANTRDTASVDTSKGSIVPVWPKEAESSLDHKGRARIPSLLEKQNLGNVNASSSTTNPNSLTERELSLLSSQGTPATTETGEFTDFWVCKYCTNVVDKDLHICDVCGNVRVD